jgi:hypothetical protein
LLKTLTKFEVIASRSEHRFMRGGCAVGAPSLVSAMEHGDCMCASLVASSNEKLNTLVDLIQVQFT